MRLVWLDDRTERQDVVLKFLKLKLLHFYENVRPSFYGTFTKAFRETMITGRRPFTKTEFVNYDEDSEAEWDHDVDDDDVYVLGYGSDVESVMYSSSDDEPLLAAELDREEWGYLSDDEGRHGVTSRPWPRNKVIQKKVDVV